VLLEVQGQAFLGTVGPHEVGSQAVHALVIASGEIPGAGALHLDDPGAQVRQLAGAERRRDGMFEADHGNAVQRTNLVVLLSHVPVPLLASLALVVSARQGWPVCTQSRDRSTTPPGARS